MYNVAEILFSESVCKVRTSCSRRVIRVNVKKQEASVKIESVRKWVIGEIEVFCHCVVV